MLHTFHRGLWEDEDENDCCWLIQLKATSSIAGYRPFYGSLQVYLFFKLSVADRSFFVYLLLKKERIKKVVLLFFHEFLT